MERSPRVDEPPRAREPDSTIAGPGLDSTWSGDLKRTGDLVVSTVARLLRARCAVFYYLDRTSSRLVCIAAAGEGDQASRIGMSFSANVGLCGRAVTERRLIVSEDLLRDPHIVLSGWALDRTLDEGLRSGIAMPLIAQNEVLGALFLGDGPGRRFTEADVALMTGFADHAAIALEMVRERREAEVLAALVRDVSASLDLDTVLQRIAEAAKELCAADLSRVALRTPGSGAMQIQYSAGTLYEEYLGLTIEPGKGVGGRVLLTGRPFRTDDYVNDPRISKDYVEAVRTDRVVGVMGVPMLSEGRVEGLLFVDRRSAHPFTDREERILLRLADHGAVAIRNAWLHKETRRRLRETEGLLAVAQTVGSILDPVEIARRAARETTLLLGGESSVFFTFDEAGEWALAVAGYRVPEALLLPDYRLRVADMPAAVRDALEGGQPVASAEVAADPRFDQAAFRSMAVEPRSMLCIPVMSRGRIRGAVLTCWWRESHCATEEEVRLAQGVIGLTVLALDNSRLYEQAQRALADLGAAQEQLVRGETLRALGKLSGGAAHHLNNLLTVVWGRVQLMLRQEEAGALRRSLEVVEQAARDAADVVRRLQEFARSEPGGTLEPVDLNDLAGGVLEMTRVRWHDVALAHGLRIEAEFERGNTPPVLGDPVALREVIMNLVVNAVDALPAGGRITLRSWCEDAMVVLSVSDTGTGMSEKVLGRVLEPFFTTKGVKSTGLGLSLSHGVIQRLGGSLSIESAEGRGTTVTLRLPAVGFAGSAPVPPSSGPGRPLRILVIDDMADVRAVLAAMLAGQGHRVAEAASGREGLARLEAGEAVDLVLTDLGMPDMTGWQVAKHVKARWPGVKVGVVTGWGDSPEATPSDRASVDFLVAKPFSPKALEQAIRPLRPRA